MDDTSIRFDNHVGWVKDTISNLNNRINTISNTSTELNTRISLLDNNILSLKSNIDASRKERSIFEDSVKSLRGETTQFTNRLGSIEKNLTSTTQNTAQITTKLDVLTKNLTSATSQLNTAKAQVNKIAQDLSSAYSKTSDNDTRYARKLELNAYPTLKNIQGTYLTKTEASLLASRQEVDLRTKQINTTLTPYFNTIKRIDNTLKNITLIVNTMRSNYVNKQELNRIVLSENSANTALLTNINTLNTSVTSLRNELTAIHNRLSTYTTKTDFDTTVSLLARKTDLTNFAKKSDLSAYALKTPADKAFVFNDNTLTINSNLIINPRGEITSRAPQNTLTNLNITGTFTIIGADGKPARVIAKDGMWAVSDINTKQDIKTLSQQEIINFNKIKPVSYVLKHGPHDRRHYGFIAQDIEKIYPNLVYQNDQGIKSINYEQVIPILAANISNLKEELENIKLHKYDK